MAQLEYVVDWYFAKQAHCMLDFQAEVGMQHHLVEDILVMTVDVSLVFEPVQTDDEGMGLRLGNTSHLFSHCTSQHR